VRAVTELVHWYLDVDVCKWLKENKPQPQHGRNWHLWLDDQYGLRKLVQDDPSSGLARVLLLALVELNLHIYFGVVL
jgi:hypothetical protein